MNGRMYDPVLGMFLSPDKFVQNPSSSQHFNRYCYAHGNPLLYTDPDGNNPVLIAMLIGYALMQADIAGKNAQSNGQSFWSGFGQSLVVSTLSMAVGYVTGGVVSSFLPSASTMFANPGSSMLWGAIVEVLLLVQLVVVL
jgi:hypothetical protein